MTSSARKRLQQIQNALNPLASDKWLSEIKQTFSPSQISEDLKTRQRFSTSFGSFVVPTPADIVVHATSREEVVKLVQIASRHGCILIPVGGRTSLEGQFSCCDLQANSESNLEENTTPRADKPVIHLDLSTMDKILAIHPTDSQAIVEPGVGWQELNKELEKRGIPLFFPVDPAPGALFGGMAGVGGSGTNAVGYGTMRGEWILSLEVVLMDGQIINTKGQGRSRKSSTGWDVARLFIGSEGTLGIITKLTLRLAPVTQIKVALTSFPKLSDAVQAAVDIMNAGLSPISLELLDDASIRGMNRAEILPEPLLEEPTVFMRFTGVSGEAIDAVIRVVESVIQKNRGRATRIAKDEKENNLLWNGRKTMFWNQQLLLSDEGCRVLITDICVPLSRLVEFVEKSDVLVKESGLFAPIVAHIGDGNIHRAILFPLSEKKTPEAVTKLASELSRLAISLEGTCAGEHGIGIKKRHYLDEELGENTVEVMRRIKHMLDPQNLLNPGKILI